MIKMGKETKEIIIEIIKKEFGHLFMEGDTAEGFLKGCEDGEEEEPYFSLKNIKQAIKLARKEGE